jgi:Htaa
MQTPCRAYNPLKPLSICLLALAALIAPSGAAAAVDGSATLKLGPGGEGLRIAGLQATASGGVTRQGARFVLPAAEVTLGKRAATVRLRGGIVLSAGKRKAQLRQLRVRVRGKRTAVSGRIGGQKVALFSGQGTRRAALLPAEHQVRLVGSQLRLTAAAARVLRERLRLETIGAGEVGSLRLDARRANAPSSTGQAPVAGPISSEPPLLARPATAVDVSGVEVTWFPRDSWIRYVSTGTGPADGIFTGNGASATTSTESPCPDRPASSSALLPYSINFTPAPSWYDPASGTAGIYGTGDVAFRWASHTIDLGASNPEIEITGASSRAIFRFSGSGGTPYPNQRADLLSLDMAAGPTAVSGDGKTFSYEFVRGTLTANGVNVFAGFYTPPDNDEFGCVSVKFTTP